MAAALTAHAAMLGSKTAAAGPAGLKPLALRVVRRRIAVVRVANIAAPAEEMLGGQGQAMPVFEVGGGPPAWRPPHPTEPARAPRAQHTSSRCPPGPMYPAGSVEFGG